MDMTIHRLAAYDHQFFRPQTAVAPKQSREQEQAHTFQEILNEKLRKSNKRQS